jgi:hypothetical protein
MPYETFHHRRCAYYTHIGQHGEVFYPFMVKDTVPTTPGEYAALAAELESLGYRVKPIKRAQHSKMLASRNADWLRRKS